MIPAVSAKQCPKCGTAAALEASECGVCAHRFRTRFVDPPLRTEPFEILILPPTPARQPAPAVPLPRLRLAALRRALPPALLMGLLWLCWKGAVAPLPPPPAAFEASVPPPVQAERLYGKLHLAMSLYDVDQMAGGLGRVLSVPDSHTLLLSYDYSDRSVRVLLDRADSSGSDYEVQAVGLYRGKILLQHSADSE